jgi:hypothetical protein
MYPVRKSEESKPNLGCADVPAGDVTWLNAKNVLNESAEGRQIVSYTEHNIKTDSIAVLIQLT